MVIGNALEWFDIVIFGYFAAVFAKLFFPAESDAAALLLAFGTFGITFLMRPLGAIVLGAYSDRYGRKSALQLSIALMTIGTAILAVLPPYAVLGIIAPALVVVARMVQGFSAGGEFGSATAFLAEQEPERRGFYASWQFASQGLTAMLATSFGVVLTTALTASELETWGWRVPFFFGILIGPVAYYIRRYIAETPEFESMRKHGFPVKELIVDGKQKLFIAIGMVALGTVVMYTILFLPTYTFRQLGLSAPSGFVGGLLTAVILVVLTPVAGILSDRYGRIPIMIVAAVAILIASYPMFTWLAAAPTLQTLLLVQMIVGVLTATYLGALPAIMSELFPVRFRTTGLSVSYAFSVACFGGFAPFIHAWLINFTGSNLAPSFYLIFAAAISLAALVQARRLGFR